VRVELTRSGGITALELTTALETDELPDSDAERLKALIETLDLDDLARRSPLRGAGADRYQYDLVVSDGEARHEVTVSEDVAPPALRALIDWLLSRANRERRTPRT